MSEAPGSAAAAAQSTNRGVDRITTNVPFPNTYPSCER
jgi:hypothetical protein